MQYHVTPTSQLQASRDSRAPRSVHQKAAASKDATRRQELQRSAGNAAVDQWVQEQNGTVSPLETLVSLQLPGQPLDPTIRAQMEARFGRGFSNVRLHLGPTAARDADALQADAFTIGSDIVFGSAMIGAGAPITPFGYHLLAHELAHVIQQQGQPAQSQSRAAQAAGLEAQAEAAAGAALSGRQAGVGPAGVAGIQRRPKDEDRPKPRERDAGSAGDKTSEKPKDKQTSDGGPAASIWNGAKWMGQQLVSKTTGVFSRALHLLSNLPTRLWHLMSGEGYGIFDLLDLAGVGEAVETVNDIVKFNTRALTPSEISVGRSIFGGLYGPGHPFAGHPRFACL